MKAGPVIRFGKLVAALDPAMAPNAIYVRGDGLGVMMGPKVWRALQLAGHDLRLCDGSLRRALRFDARGLPVYRVRAWAAPY